MNQSSIKSINGNKLKLNDGTLWEIELTHISKILYWNENDIIMYHYHRSGLYPYKLINSTKVIENEVKANKVGF